MEEPYNLADRFARYGNGVLNVKNLSDKTGAKSKMLNFGEINEGIQDTLFRPADWMMETAPKALFSQAKRVGKSFMGGMAGKGLAAGAGVGAFGAYKMGVFGARMGVAMGGAGIATARLAYNTTSNALLGGVNSHAIKGGGFVKHALFPNLYKADANLLEKFAINPRVGSRLIKGLAIGSLGYAAMQSMNNAPPPSVYFDGEQTRHLDDMGATGNWALSQRRRVR
jgi:hypothetical protein